MTYYNFQKIITRKDYIPYRDDYLVRKCKDRRVLHIGAADWPYTQEKHKNNDLLYVKIDKTAKHQLGIDLNKEGVDYLNNLDTTVSETMCLNLDEKINIDYNPDIIVFGETLEHLTNLSVALENIRRLMTEETELIVSIPNALNFGQIIMAFFGREMQHPDHKVAFTYKTITQLFHHTGFKIKSVKFTWLSKDLSHLNYKGAILQRLSFIVSKIFPMFAGNIILVVKK